MEKRKDVTHSLLDIDNVKEFGVSYDYHSPELKNYDELKEVIEEVSKRYQNYVITSDEEAYEVGKRGGLLTKLRKISGRINEYKVDVHRKAKESYSDFDKKMNDLNYLINDAIISIKDQVDDYKKQKEIEMMNETHELFKKEKNSKQFKGKLPKWCSYKLFIKFNPNAYKLNENKKKIEISQFLYKIYKDSNEIVKEYNENYKSKIFVQSCVENYVETLDIDKSIRIGIHDHNEFIKSLEEYTHEKQKDNEKTIEKHENKKTGQVSKESKERVWYTFSTPDKDFAKRLKKLMDERNVEYTMDKFIK